MTHTASDDRTLALMLDHSRTHLAEALGIMMICLDHDERFRRRSFEGAALRAHVGAPTDPGPDAWSRLRLRSRR